MSDQKECVISVEELCPRKTFEKTMGSSPTNDPDGFLKKLDEMATKESAKQESPNCPKIQKVPIIFGEQLEFKKHFEPRVVSFGPAHHGKKNLRVAEGYKLNLTAAFVKNSGKQARVLYEGVKARIAELKEYFEKEMIEGYQDDTLSLILFLDGCSILQFIYTLFEGDLMDFHIKNHHIALAQNDVFLLENQIPFEVLQLLMDSTKDDIKTKMKDAIRDFIISSIMAPEKNKKALKAFDVDKPKPIHLLGLLHRAMTFPAQKSPVEDKAKNVQYSFRSVQELKAAGIIVKPGRTCSLKEISFSSFCLVGRLRLPPLIVDDSTALKFLNLIAYEACPDNSQTEYEITSYVWFLDTLIDDPNDVKELRSKKILVNHMGCDEDVASLFNKIATDLVTNPKAFQAVKTKIQQHYDNKYTTWMAEVSYTHFSSPWTLMAFIGALLALVLTGIQAWYAIFPKKT